MVNFSKQKRLGALALVAWGGALGHSAFVQAGPASLADCAAIANDQARLACYDQAATRLAPTALEPGPVSTAMTVPVVPPEADEPAEVRAWPPVEGTLIERAWGFEPDSNRYAISLYRPNYLLLGRYSDRPNEAPFDVLFNALDNPDAKLDSTEAQFQISFKARLWTTDDRRFGIWAAYTQQNQWQVYNDDLSRPFRETNYQPELILSFKPGLSFGGFHWGLLNLGYNHQSNGRSDPISRSWDRIVAEIGIERGDFALLIRPWVVISDGGDDNPDIEDYYGHGDITAFYRWRGNSFSVMGRGNVDTGKGTVKFSWMSPPLIGPMRGYVKGSSGYGDSMIDYNWRQNTIGIGVALNDVL
ncbi:phospholipase A [Thioalkalicoccus limnaeus]|uniref:Phospholipase A1 n=1 Tax=Thioalkalicoccus limnaeus TaxID=120681 RepID=A0ABV4BGF0_9GAMM